MQALSRWLVKRSVAWAIVAFVTLLSVVSIFYARKVEQDDDVLAFLPKGNRDVQVFYDVNRRFGGLDIAIAGIETKNVFSKDFLARLRALTARLNATLSGRRLIGRCTSCAIDTDKTSSPRGQSSSQI